MFDSLDSNGAESPFSRLQEGCSLITWYFFIFKSSPLPLVVIFVNPKILKFVWPWSLTRPPHPHKWPRGSWTTPNIVTERRRCGILDRVLSLLMRLWILNMLKFSTVRGQISNARRMNRDRDLDLVELIIRVSQRLWWTWFKLFIHFICRIAV